MSRIADYKISPEFLVKSKSSLKRHFPSDLLYTFGAALFETSNASRSYNDKQFYRKCVTRVLSAVRSIRALEGQYFR